ncbi:riboflavin biosynthesis protein RibF [Candidatus Bipolaricaulota bacterium]
MKRGTIVSIGTFDGVHLGHQAILRELRHQAQTHALSSLVYAFSVPPRWVMSDTEGRYLLLPESVKLALLRKSVDIVHPASFDAVRSMGPEEFVKTVLIHQLNARVIVEGEAFRFGRDRSGDLETLRSLGAQLGLDVVGVPPVNADHEIPSSTRIRELVRAGDFRTAGFCLGRPPMLLGSVIRGDQLGGKLGYPTANLAVNPHILLPNPGIFLVHAYGEDIRSAGLLYVGTRPTLGNGDLRCEVHLLDSPERPLYDSSLEIHLLERIRGDRSFPTLDALRSQIGTDIATARELLSSYSLSEERISS